MEVPSHLLDSSIYAGLEDASSLGANAVIGIDVDYETVQINEGGSMLMVTASGSAVRVG